MSRLSLKTCAALLILIQCVSFSNAHSWLDCVQVTNPLTVTNLNNMQCAAYPRGYVGRSNPDANMWKIEGISQQTWTGFPACRNPNRQYSAQYPMLRLKAGETMTIAYTPNGHTMWHRPPPPNGPRNMYVKWTGRAGVDLRTMSEVSNAASLLTVQFDTPCHSRVNGAQLDSSAGICQADVRIPAGTPPGIYQFVWWWPFDFAGGNVIEEYTTCWDVEVTGSAPAVTTGVVTTGRVTTGPVTTGPVTTGVVTTGQMTTGTGSSSGSSGGGCQNCCCCPQQNNAAQPEYLVQEDGAPAMSAVSASQSSATLKEELKVYYAMAVAGIGAGVALLAAGVALLAAIWKKQQTIV